MQKAQLILRYLLGIALLVFGLNKFLGFMPPPELPQAAGQFMGALAATGYMFPLIGSVELLVGVLLFSRLSTPLALVLLLPISVNIVCFHVFLAPESIAPAALIAGLNLVLLFMNKAAYKELFPCKRCCCCAKD